MSLFRRIWLTIIGLTLAVFIGSLLVNTLTARSYLEKQLDIKNKDNATALALAMSQQSDKDPVTMELLLSALFDNGHYQEIRLTDPAGKLVVERKAPANLDLGAPAWFVALLPIRVSPGVAHIANGWKQYGSISLTSHSKFAYRDLWTGTLDLVGWFVLSGVVAGILGTLLLRLITRPLDQVVDQARAISDRRFVNIAATHVPELDSVVNAMNGMVNRLKQIFAEEASRLDVLRKKINHDKVTGLPNRDYFLGRLREALESEDAAAAGVFLMLRIKDLAAINRLLGHAETDRLLCGVARALREACVTRNDCLPARLNGQDFALLAQNQGDALALADGVRLAMLRLRDASFSQCGELFYVSATRYKRGDSPGNVLACCDQLLARAEGQEANTCATSEDHGDTTAFHPAEAWRAIIVRAIEAGRIKLDSYPVMGTRSRQLLHRECVVRLQIDDAGPWHPAGDFIPFAIRFRQTPVIDARVARLALDELKLVAGNLAINLSAETVADLDARQQFIEILEHSKELCPRLWVEVPVIGVTSHFEAFHELSRSLNRLGCKVGIENFGRRLNEMNRLAGLCVDYVKVNSNFVQGIDANEGNQEFLAGLCKMAHGVGMQVIAVGVQSTREIDTLAALDFDGVTGPAVSEAE